MTLGVFVGGASGCGKTSALKSVMESLVSPASPLTHVISLDVMGEIGQVGAPCDAAPAWYADRVCTMHRTVNVGAGKNTSLDPFTLAREMAADPSIDEDQFRGMVSDFLDLLLVPVVVHTAKNGDVLESGMRGSHPGPHVLDDVVASARGRAPRRRREHSRLRGRRDPPVQGVWRGSHDARRAPRRDEVRAHARARIGNAREPLTCAPGFSPPRTSPRSARECSTCYHRHGPMGSLYRAATARDVDDSPTSADVYSIEDVLDPVVHERVRHSVVHLKNLDERRRAVVVRHVLMLLTLRIADFASRTGSTQHRPRVALVIDEVGKLCPRTEDSGGMMARMLADFLKLNRKHGIVLIMATQDVGSLDPSVLKALGGPTILGYQGTRDAWKRLVSARYGGKKGIQDPVCARIVDAVTRVDRARHQFVRLPSSRTEEEQIFTFDVPHHPHLDARRHGRARRVSPHRAHGRGTPRQGSARRVRRAAKLGASCAPCAARTHSAFGFVCQCVRASCV